MVSEFKPLGKIIVVAGRNSLEAVFLKRILSFGKKRNITVSDSEDSLSGTSRAGVLLLADRNGRNLRPSEFATCVVEYSLSQEQEFARLNNTVTYSAEKDGADFTARNIRLTQENRAAFEIVGVGIIGRVRLKSGDASLVPPALAAATAAIAAGVPFAEVLEGLNGMEIGGR